MQRAERERYVKHWADYLPGLQQDDMAMRYMWQVYDHLELMRPGQFLKLEDPKNPKREVWLCVAVGWFLCSLDHWLHYDLREDYLWVRCYADWPSAWMAQQACERASGKQ